MYVRVDPIPPEITMRPRTMFAFGLLALVLMVTGCAGPNPMTGTHGLKGVAGFWAGAWHGLICPIAFAISFFKHDVAIYEVHNSGHWYDFGFILGAGAWGVLRPGGSSARRSR